MAIWLAVLLTASAPVDFDAHVAPILTKAGCNAAACHGSATGRGNFKLSLFAGDLDADYDAIVKQFEGRRVQFTDPESSLFLAKPLGLLEHGGGVRFDFGHPFSQTIHDWIAAGAPRTGGQHYTALRIDTADPSIDEVPASFPVRVLAQLQNENAAASQWVDVTELSVFLPADEEAIQVDEQGLATVSRGGRHTLVVRFLNLVTTTQYTAPIGTQTLAKFPRSENWIDDHIFHTLHELRLEPAERATDPELVRRITLDLTGRLPTPVELEGYLNSDDPEKYSQLVNQLLASNEFVEYWTFVVAEWLRVRAPGGSDFAAAEGFRAWLKSQLEHGVGFDQLAEQLLAAEGDSHSVSPATFYRLAGDARQQAEYVSEALLGIRLRCANCHNHPLDRWTQDDYHGLAAIFSRVDTGRYVRTNSRGEVVHPQTGEAARCRIPGQRFLESSEDARRAFSDWVIREDNPYFARASVNRLWKTLMGRGLIEPVDDLRDTNPASHPSLLDQLTVDFREHDYDLRHSIRLIVLSAAYQRSSRAGSDQSNAQFYARANVRRLPAAVLADAIDAVTSIESEYNGYPIGTRAISLADSQQAPALEVLGGCARNESCEGATGVESPGITARLHLFNGPLLNAKLQATDNRIDAYLDNDQSDEFIVRDLYLRTLSRLPNREEQSFWLDELQVTSSSERRRRLEDFLWALLNCQEFVTNH